MNRWVSYELEQQRANADLELAETVFNQAQDAILLVGVTTSRSSASSA